MKSSNDKRKVNHRNMQDQKPDNIVKANDPKDTGEGMLRVVFERISDGFVALDANWCYTYMNKRAGEIFNRDPETMIGKHIWTEFPEGVGQLFYKASYKAMAEQIYVEQEEYYPALGKWFINHIYPSPNGLSIYFNDITERKKTEERIRINELRLVKGQELGNLGYWELPSHSTKIWGSKKAMEIFGLGSEEGEVPVEKVESLIPEIETLRQAAMGLILENKKYEIELLIHPADGSGDRYISAIGEIEPDRQGKPARIMGVVKDITNEKRAEQKIIELLQKNKEILENISDGFVVVDRNWSTRYWNHEAETAIRINGEDISGKNFLDLYKDLSGLKSKNELRQAMNENMTVRFEEYFPPKDKWYRLTVYPSKDGVCVFLRDITEAKRQERLARLEKDTYEYYTSHKASLEEMLTFLLDGIQKIHPSMLCSVLKVKDGKMYNWVSSQLPEAYNKEVEGLEIGIGRGSCGTSAFLREKVEVAEIATHPYWELYHPIAATYGLKSCWSYPIIDSHNKLLGTFGIYHTQIHPMKKEEEQTIDRARIILLNIMENRLAEDASKAYKEQLELVFNTTIDIVFLVSVTGPGRYLFEAVNKPFLEATGLEKSQVEGKYIEDIVPKAVLPQVLEKYEEAIRTGKTVSWDQTVKYPTGVKTGIVSISPVFNERNECVMITGTSHDITERKRSEEVIDRYNKKLKFINQQLKDKNRQLEHIAWTQSHKVRAPLARIMGLIDLIANHTTDEASKKHLFAHVIDASKELDEVIRDIVKKTEKTELSS